MGRKVRIKEWGLESGKIDKKKEMGVKKVGREVRNNRPRLESEKRG